MAVSRRHRGTRQRADQEAARVRARRPGAQCRRSVPRPTSCPLLVDDAEPAVLEGLTNMASAKAARTPSATGAARAYGCTVSQAEQERDEAVRGAVPAAGGRCGLRRPATLDVEGTGRARGGASARCPAPSRSTAKRRPSAQRRTGGAKLVTLVSAGGPSCRRDTQELQEPAGSSPASTRPWRNGSAGGRDAGRNRWAPARPRDGARWPATRRSSPPRRERPEKSSTSVGRGCSPRRRPNDCGSATGAGTYPGAA